MLNIFSSKKQSKKGGVKNPKFITNSDEIYQMIKRICDEQIPLILHWENAPQEETTYLLKAGTELFVLDRLEDQPLHESLLSADSLKARANVEGVNVTFNITLPDRTPHANSSYYKAYLPEKIYNPQRRDRFRLTVPDDFKIPFMTKYGLEETPLKGELIDLSSDGLGIMLDSRVFVRKGERIRSCTLSPPGGHAITFDIEIRSTRPCERDEQMMRIGARIVDPNRKAQKLLRKTVHKLEKLRMQDRKKRNNG